MSGEKLYPFIDEISVDRANLWSYIVLKSSNIIYEKVGLDKREISRRKQQLLENLAEASRVAFNHSKHVVLTLLENVKEALITNGFRIKIVKAKLSSRGLIGVGEIFGKMLFEVGLSFNPILNIPFIPGSSLKGAIRAAYQELYLRYFGEENKDVCEEECRRIFGEPGRSVGIVGFTDAYPVEAGEKGFILYPDVMTPHYGESVQTELDVQPNPIVYLTVAPGTVFQFYVFWRNRGERRVRIGMGPKADFSPSSKPILDDLALLDRAILYSMKTGVGAKTSLGYSSFEVIEYTEV